MKLKAHYRQRLALAEWIIDCLRLDPAPEIRRARCMAYCTKAESHGVPASESMRIQNLGILGEVHALRSGPCVVSSASFHSADSPNSVCPWSESL